MALPFDLRPMKPSRLDVDTVRVYCRLRIGQLRRGHSVLIRRGNLDRALGVREQARELKYIIRTLEGTRR